MKQKAAKATVLIVDDDPDFLAQLRMRLESDGYAVRAAGGVEEAEASLREERPALAIIDLMMEQIDSGFTLAHRIREFDPAIPVIMVTGVTGETGLMFETATSGERSWIRADAVLDKPIRYEQLQREMRRLLPGG